MAIDPIDHKDQPGEYREQVRAAVFIRVGGQGQPMSSRDLLVGDWTVSSIGLKGEKTPFGVYRLKSNGSAVIEMPGHPPLTENKWQLNDDGSFSMFVWVAPMPEYGSPDPTHEEQRMHLAVLPDKSFVLWNGDGSMVLLLSPLANDRERQ